MTPQERLRFLADALCRPFPPQVEFNLGLWRVDAACGSICCAVGYAASLPELQAEGLTIVADTNGLDAPYFKGIGQWNAVKAFFGLTKQQALKLFLPDQYPAGKKTRPDEVAGRIYAHLNAQRGETA